MNARKIVRKTFKIFLWIFGIIFGILLAAIIALQLPPVQKFITQKAVAFLEGKLKTKVGVGGVNVGFPKYIVINKLYAEDQKKDTLLYAEKISVDIDFWALKKKKIDINKVKLESINAHILRAGKDSVFNYDFIIKAFTSPNSKPKDTTAKAWEFKIDKVALENIALTYKDDSTHNDMALRLGSFYLSFDKFDLTQSTFLIDNIELAHTKFSYSNTTEPKINLDNNIAVDKEKNSEKKKLKTALGKLKLEDVHVFYFSKAGGQTLKADVGNAVIKTNKLDIDEQYVDAQQLTLNNSMINFRQDIKINKKPSPNIDRTATPAAPGWKMKLEELGLEGNSFIYNDQNKKPQKGQIDFAHLQLTAINITSDHILYAGDTIQANIKELSAREKSGLVINNFKTDFFLDQQNLKVGNLVLQTPNTNLKADVKSNFNSFKNLSKDYADMIVNIAISESKISVKDILYFQPDLLNKTPLHIEKNTVLHLKARVDGKIKDLTIHEMVAGTLNDTQISANGNIKGLPDIDKTSFKINIAPFQTSSADLRYLLPPKILPRSILLPNSISLVAHLTGAVHNCNADLNLKTSLGEIITIASLTSNKQFSYGTYKGKIDIKNLALGKILKQSKTMGNLTMKIGFDGAGFKKEDMNARLAAVINSLYYQKYNYHNAVINVDAKPSLFAGSFNMADPNATVTIKASANYREEVPRYIADIDLKNIAWKKLNFAKKDIRSRLKMTADLKYRNMNDINGNIGIRKVAVINAGKVYVIDSLLYVSIQDKDKTDIKVDSDIMSGYFKGNINFGGIAGALQNHFDNYFNTKGVVKKKKKSAPQNFDFKLDLKNPALITDILIPKLDSLKPGEISGKFDSAKDRLDFKTEIFGLKYAGIRADSIDLDIKSNAKKLNAIFSVAKVKSGKITLK